MGQEAAQTIERPRSVINLHTVQHDAKPSNRYKDSQRSVRGCIEKESTPQSQQHPDAYDNVKQSILFGLEFENIAGMLDDEIGIVFILAVH